MTVAQFKAHQMLETALAKDPIVIIGNGPVGVKAAQVLLGESKHIRVVIYGDEMCHPYNRVQLSLYLAGDVGAPQLDNSIMTTQCRRLEQLIGHRVVNIDAENQVVTDQHGNRQAYSKLIIATGSKAFMPNVPGKQKKGIHTFRSLEDANELIRQKKISKSICVVGSGALGLETAISMKTPSNTVYVGVRNKLLSKEIDDIADGILKERIQSSGVELLTGLSVTRIIGDDHVTSIELSDGKVIDVDTVIYCVGIRPNVELVNSTDINVNRGIVVDDHMCTNDSNIYAIGECSEHKGKTYGVVAPGLEQAKICADHILGESSEYLGSINNLSLKIDRHTTGIYGEISSENADEVYQYNNRLKGVFRKLFIKDHRVIGTIYIGGWDEINRVKEHIQKGRRIRVKGLKKFSTEGIIWNEAHHSSIKQQPEDYIVCLCQNVTRGALSNSMKCGNRTIDSLCENTHAGITCGSCRPLLAEMLDQPTPNLVMRHYKSIFAASILSLLIIFAIFLNRPIAASISVQVGWYLEQLWYDNFWKQVSGYTLLLLCVLGGAIGVRKRWSKLNTGNLDNWRLFHSIIGVIALIVLVVHTGFRLGENLNFALMMAFLLATTTGSLVGVFMSKNHHWSDLKLREHRKWWSRIHYTLLWLLPALIGYHIFAVYYF